MENAESHLLQTQGGSGPGKSHELVLGQDGKCVTNEMDRTHLIRDLGEIFA